MDRKTREMQLAGMSSDELLIEYWRVMGTTGTVPHGLVYRELAKAILQHEFPDSETDTLSSPG